MTFSLSYWNLTSKGLVAKNGVLFSNKYDPLPLLLLAPAFTLSHSDFVTCLLTLTLFPSFSLSSSLASMDLPFSPSLPPGLVSPWPSHVLFQSTGAQGGNEIWRPSLNGHAHILCNYLRLRTRAQLSIYKSVPLTGPSRLLKLYPADASW